MCCLYMKVICLKFNLERMNNEGRKLRRYNGFFFEELLFIINGLYLKI